LSLFNLTGFRAGFAKGFYQSLNVNTLPKGLLTHCVLLTVMFAAQWDNAPIIWLLPHPCTATIANMSAFDWHPLATISGAME
jgi:hypothetical protein